MEALWIALGVVILAMTLLDTFLAVLNYDEAGIFVNRIVRAQWVVLRSFTRRVSRRWRPLVLRQVTGILLLTTILGWIFGIVLGFTLIYLGLIGLGAFQIDSGVTPDFVGALYLSVGQFATVGADNISPAGGWVNLIPVAQALTSVVLLSFIITFLSNIYGVIQFLRSLCADFFQTGPGVGSPTDALRPYLPDGQPRDLDRHLNELVDDFNLYCDSIRQDHAAYLFQSGEDQFSLPFALYMTSGVVGALSWGLPTGHPATRSPSLVRIQEVFDDFRVRRYRMMRWRPPVTPVPVGVEQFRSDFAAFRAHTSREAIDRWVLRFLALNAEMADVIGADGPGDPDDAYARYTGWLAFAYPAEQFVSRVARDLDYQPIYRGDAPAADDDAPRTAETDAASPPAMGAPASSPRRRRGRLVVWLRRRLLFLDPGSIRLRDALRALGAVVAAVVVAVAVSRMLGFDQAAAGAFAALIAVFSAPLAAGGRARLRLAGLLAAVPVFVGTVAAAFVPRGPATTIIVLAVVAAGAIWLGRFGRRWAVCGQLAFLAYYFALLLAVDPAELLVALAAAAIGVACSWLANLVPDPRGARVVDDAVEAVAERAGVLSDAVIDALSNAGDRHLVRVLRADNAALRDAVTFLSGLLDGPAARGAHPDELRVRQLQAFDVQLAASNLLRTLPAAIADTALTMDERSRLAGDLAEVQRRLRQARREDADGAGAVAAGAMPAAGSALVSGTPLHGAIREFGDAVDALLARPSVPIEPAVAVADEGTPGDGERASAGTTSAAAVPRAAVRAVDRRAVQGGLATGLSLFLGSFVSASQQLWAALPAYQTLTESDGERLGRTFQRLIGVVAGAAAGFGLALATRHDPIVAFAVVVASVFFMSFLRAVAAAWTAFWQTVLLATLYDVLARLDVEAIHLRVVETAIGALVALVVAAVVLPTRTRARVRAEMSDFIGATAAVTHSAIQRFADPPLVQDAAARRALAEREGEMQRDLDDVLRHASPLRLDPGALQPNGIQSQLTSLTALARYARQLVEAADGAPASGIRPSDWQLLDARTRGNFQAALAVLDGRLPASVNAMVSDPAVRHTDDDPGVVVARINETLIAYLAAVRPGSSDDMATDSTTPI